MATSNPRTSDLSPAGTAALREAQQQGYLLCDTRARRDAVERYAAWCSAWGVPMVIADYGGDFRNRSVVLEIDLFAPRGCATCQAALLAFLAEHNHGPRYGVNPSYAHATRIPREHAPFVARRAAQLARRMYSCQKGGEA
jgi:hypothetical protein